MIPTIDPQVKYKGTSYLRTLNTETMKAIEGVVVIQDADAEPLIVIVPFDTYLTLQNQDITLAGIGGGTLAGFLQSADSISDPPEPTPQIVRKSVNGEMVVPGPRSKRISKREALVQERAASDAIARKTGRDDIDYSDTDSTPTTHVATLDADAPNGPKGKVSMEQWRANRKPLHKPKDRK